MYMYLSSPCFLMAERCRLTSEGYSSSFSIGEKKKRKRNRIREKIQNMGKVLESSMEKVNPRAVVPLLANSPSRYMCLILCADQLVSQRGSSHCQEAPWWKPASPMMQVVCTSPCKQAGLHGKFGVMAPSATAQTFRLLLPRLCRACSSSLGLCNKMEVPCVRLQALLICFTVPVLFWLSAGVTQLGWEALRKLQLSAGCC